ncbi:hypothetical protein PAAG_12132 [Paracoccidioides lutzii Pb01]|uniref:Uncharacterized protein n=1 Tax=Paracoccidioides lutzii (strain ATCC MYA-826 / Pb01) TaxID=502779 RepID=A0A0A2V4D7_PARBA|nr:hypothetical protein PAAG_12132 [Paracoccidioides lutzii Pb01]KGQ01187.1 hypothetical protein PAAG_12132 [Paracoccidioides lutzii Pb01]
MRMTFLTAYILSYITMLVRILGAKYKKGGHRRTTCSLIAINRHLNTKLLLSTDYRTDHTALHGGYRSSRKTFQLLPQLNKSDGQQSTWGPCKPNGIKGDSPIAHAG